MAKPTLVVLPFLLLLFDFLPMRRSALELNRKVWIEKIPLFLICVLFSALVYFTQNQSGTMNSFADLSFASRVGAAMVHFWLYVIKSVWPVDLSVFYPRVEYSLGIKLCASLSFLSVSYFLFRKRQKYPLFLFAWAWFFISLLPILGFVQIGGQGIANRWTYLPQVGLAIALGAFLNPFTRFSAFKVYLPLTFIALAAAGKTQLDLPQWKNSEALFSEALASNPDNFLAHNNLAIALEKKGDLKSAKQHYEESLRIHPSYSEALDNLGRLQAQRGNYQAAVELFQKSLGGDARNIEARYNLALAYYHLGEKQKALVQWLETLNLEPSYAPTLSSLRFMSTRERDTPCLWNDAEVQDLRITMGKIKMNSLEEELQNTLLYWQSCVGAKAEKNPE